MKIQNRVPLETLRAKESLDTKFKEVSKLYEKQFLREMVKAMRSTVHEGGFVQSNHAEKIFRDQLDNEYVETWGDQGGLGLSELIYQQLNEKFGQKSLQGRGISKPQGPISIEPDSQFKIKMKQQNPDLKNQIQNQIQFQKKDPTSALNSVDLTSGSLAEVEIKMPWAGVISKTYELGSPEFGLPKQTIIEVEHEGGFTSQFLGSGLSVTQTSGKTIEANEGFAKVNLKMNPSLYWTIKTS